MFVTIFYVFNFNFADMFVCKIRKMGGLHCNVRTPLQSFVGPWPLFQFLNPIHSR
jgi:hypothetical protein